MTRDEDLTSDQKLRRDEVEERLLRLFAGEAGGRERIDVHEPISNYGIDSVSVANILGDVESWSGRSLDPAILWKQPSIRGLANHLASQAPLPRQTASTPATRASALEFPDFETRLRELNAVGNPFFRSFQGEPAARLEVEGRSVVNFASYNYLGLANHPDVKRAASDAVDRYGTSVSASRVSSGERDLHGALEKALARFVGAEAALAFPAGYATNVSVIGHLLSPGDLVVHDALMHNSAVTGARLSGAKVLSFPHNDYRRLDELLARERHAHARALVIAEGVYSGDGDAPDLAELVRVKNTHRAWLMIDEAHSIGVLGARGRGLAEHAGVPPKEIDIHMGTLSKSLASCGGYIAGTSSLVRYLRYTCPGFVFSAGLSPANAAAALRAIEIIEAEPERAARLRSNARTFQALAREHGLDTGLAAGTGVIPVMIGEDEDAITASNRLFDVGVNAQPMISPAVPIGSARLRFFISVDHTLDDLRTAATLTAAAFRARAAQVATVV